MSLTKDRHLCESVNEAGLTNDNNTLRRPLFSSPFPGSSSENLGGPQFSLSFRPRINQERLSNYTPVGEAKTSSGFTNDSDTNGPQSSAFQSASSKQPGSPQMIISNPGDLEREAPKDNEVPGAGEPPEGLSKEDKYFIAFFQADFEDKTLQSIVTFYNAYF